MTIALWCILVAGLLPYLGTAFAKWGFEKFDNNNPRQWLANQTGFRARGNAAQANSFEAFPLFAAGVLVATITQAPTGSVNCLAAIFVIARFLFIICYVTDKGTLRSLCWTVGIGCAVGLFIVSGLYSH
jgi:uncharacterized MAPEG superfamily protein